MAPALRGRAVRRGAVVGLICIGLLLWAITAVIGADGGDYLGSFGPDGTANTKFEAPGAVAVDQATGAVYVIDRQKQVLYKFDSSGNPVNWGGSAGYLSGNQITGLAVSVKNGGSQVAVDQETHVVYVTSNNRVRAFESNGDPHIFPAVGTSEISGATELSGVATDKYGDIYASDGDSGKIRIYARSGALLTEFVAKRAGAALTPVVRNLSVSPSGTLYVVEANSYVLRFEPSQFPITPTTTFSQGTKVNDLVSRTVAVDPSTSYVYIGEEISELNTRVAIYDAKDDFVAALGAAGQPGDLPGSPVGVGVGGPEKRAYVSNRVEGEQKGPQQVEIFEALRFHEGPPTISASSVTNVTSHSAKLQARINPNTFETTYWFEYGQVDCAVAEPGECTKVPLSGATIEPGHEPVLVSASISGLEAGTKYFYRTVAETSESEEPESSPTRTFTTQKAQFGSRLADGRVWEQVTPANKFGGAITNAGLVQADQSGPGIAFQTRGPIVEDPEGNRALETAAVLARRSESGWSVEDLVPPHTEAGGLGFGPEFKLFSEDLEHAVFEPRDDVPLSPEASERTPYLRTNTIPPGFRPLVTSKEGYANVPAGTVFGGEASGDRNPVAVSGANGSLTYVALSAKPALVEEAEERSLYLWHDGSLEAVSKLPAGEGGKVVRAQLGSGTISVRHAVSEDGSRVFWAPGDPLTASLDWPALYLRDTVADETVRLDVPEEGVTPVGPAHPAFMNASVDGSVVFFTDSQQLTSDASPEGRDLYRCEIGDVGGALGCVDLEDLSAPLEGSGESGEARELALGVSDDGDTIYFAAYGVLDTQPNANNEHAVPDTPNLYVWRDGQGVRFVANLSENDSPDWGRIPKGPTSLLGHGALVTADSSPSGRYLAFMSERNLTGAESNDPETGEPVEQAFLYDAVEDELICVSCNPNGSTDAGHVVAENFNENGVIFADPKQLWAGRWVGATLAEPSEGEPTSGFALYWPRTVLDSGRTYFNSTSPLAAGDSNGTWDVYQYEPFGTGDCSPSASSALVATTETGCVGLMSSGTDDLGSVFMDSSESGDDVFLATFGRLSVLDTDDIVDIYDARVGGVAAAAEPPPAPCAGEACQQSGPPPAESAPNSATFNGAGNVKQIPHRHCRKGQRRVRRHGKVRCVRARHHHRHHGKHQQSARSGEGA